MNGRLLCAAVFFLLGSIKIVDWFIFCEKNRALKSENYSSFKSKYIEHFPDWIKPLFNSRPEIAALVSIALFTIAGLLFLNSHLKCYRAAAVLSFFLAFWNLFSIM